jgi:hypothetical protein
MPCSLDSTSLFDHSQDQAIAVVSRLDAVDGVFQLGREALDVGKITQAGCIGIGGNGQRVFRAGQIHANHLNGVTVQIGLSVRLHGGHPIAQEDIDVFVLHRREGHRNR